MLNNSDYSVLVNTTDSFEDCWLPFFKLFKHYWPEYKGKIYHNTEHKDFEYRGFDIISLKNSEGINKKLTWSECLIRALNKIDSENVLYLQEDYFFNNFVKNDWLYEFYDKFLKLDCDCLHLTDQSTPGPFKETNDKNIWKIEKNAPYKISCQAAFWKKDILSSYLRKHETAWQFEHYGTKRSRRTNHRFFVINHDIYGYGKKEILPYIFTGIIKGKWNEQVKQLFLENRIEIDFSRRGFYTPSNKKTFIKKIQGLKLNEIKSRILSQLDLIVK